MKRFQSFLACGLLAGASVSAPALAADAGLRDVSGDFRIHVYAENWRDARSGATADDAFSGARFRLRLKREMGENCRFQTRFAAAAADRANDWNLYIRPDRDSGTAVNPGTATFDEFFVQCESLDSNSQWRFGRLQSNLDLPHMATRSLDRSQASSLNIGWTDGITFRQKLGEQWYGEIVAQYNGADGNGQTTRGSFDSMFSAAVEHARVQPVMRCASRYDCRCLAP